MKEIGLYIHIPFCKEKCKYCDFSSVKGSQQMQDRYIDALLMEIEENIKGYDIETVFIGGGTPSYLSDENLEKLLKKVGSLNLKKEYEYTIECNPGTLTENKLKIMKDNGVNRLSIGLQSCDDGLLKILGRIHNFKEFQDNYTLARKMGFDNINIDLMFGLPDQSLQGWKDTLEKIIELNPEHISCYGLIIEEGTVFYKLYDENKIILPDEAIERDMYRYAIETLEKAQYGQYEISNFSKEGLECKHNLKYWNLEEYVACGTAAHSYNNGVRYRNEENIEKYILKINHEKKAIVEKIINSREDDMEEFVFLGFRKMEGVDVREFYRRFHESIFHVYEPIIEKYKNLGLMEVTEDKIFLTAKGIEISNTIMADFLL